MEGRRQPDDTARLARARARMVEADLRERGIRDGRVLDAMGEVRRELFVPERLRLAAYDDMPLPIGEGQTISQPFVVARMAELAEVRPGDRVLEIGTGSGYGAAVLGRLAAHVVTLERYGRLVRGAVRALVAAGADNVEVHHDDGTRGWPSGSPYDAIVVTAGAREVPPALVDQLADGGRLVMPVGWSPDAERLVVVRRRGDELARRDLDPVRFVPLLPGLGGDDEGDEPDEADEADGDAGAQGGGGWFGV